jgi:hypothetical protein
MSAFVSGRDATPLVGFEGAIVLEEWRVLFATRPPSGVTNRALPLFTMSDGDDSAALWKVNRTIHELVKDRVQQLIL